MTELAFSLDRTVVIRARRATVFRYFTDPDRFARWWGVGSTIDAVVGGAVVICMPGGARALGTVREIVPDVRVAFTYGYEGDEPPIAPGGSLVTVTLADDPEGTRLHLRHDVADARARDLHVQGWRHQLSVFARVAADEAQAAAADRVAAWFAAWNAGDDDARRAALADAVTPDVGFLDPNGVLRGADDLVPHIAASQRIFPGVRLEARGPVRQVHGVALVDWATVAPDGASRATGTNVFRFALDGRITEVTGVPAA